MHAASALTFAAAAVLGATGCIIVDDDDDDVVYVVEEPAPEGPYVSPASDVPTNEVIDTGAILEAEPGAGVGVFVEYTAGGQWSIRTTCDNAGVYCVFDIEATVDNASQVVAIDKPELEGADFVEPYANAGFRLHAETGADADRVLFTTTPGAIVRFAVALDGVAEGRYFFWVGNGVLHQGAPTNPLDLTPSSP